MTNVIYEAKIQCRHRQFEVRDDFQLSVGWLTNFINRYSFKSRRIHGESGEVDINVDSIQEAYNSLPNTAANYIQRPNYVVVLKFIRLGSLLFEFVMLMDPTISLHILLVVMKLDKDLPGKVSRFVEFIFSNAYKYGDNTKGWMTKDIFRKILRKTDNAVYAAHKDKNVLLLMDNGPSHKILDILELENVELYTLPPNTTSHYQPLDTGIITALKNKYQYIYKCFNT
ncbi:hypothetical protein INT45_003720 [Circinella minor]|uniref:DDE-1 domain-containing protein n=1 Tax=Circinella minor TaxID=1195481 RepID=A0A8H7S9J3_9FUNG|nr:hypothetical protein INT45_003720 [Circinella minor]